MKGKNPSLFGGKSKTMILLVWLVLALAGAVGIMLYLQSSLPLFTLLCLLAPLIVLLIKRDASSLGFNLLSKKDVLAAGIALAVLFIVSFITEKLTHTYSSLVQIATTPPPADITFGWLAKSRGVTGWLGMLTSSALVALFAEEVFFRGWLLTAFLKKMKPGWVIFLQALLFTLPQSLAAIAMPGLQAVVYITVFSFLIIGIGLGLLAWRQRSFVPGLVVATLLNLCLTVLLLFS